MRGKLFISAIIVCIMNCVPAQAQKSNLPVQVRSAMLKATKFMVDEVSSNDGYVWYYATDLSRQWGEMEAYKSMIWMQHPGTVSMGHTFLDAYHATNDNYYYQAAAKVANAIIKGQSKEGGWNYMVDFAGEASIKNWYNTIGKNGWRLEEFQHYYGNSTFDDDVTSDAARFLLRIYLEKNNTAFKKALDKAINFILVSQYANGGWPQRYPLRYDFQKQGHPDYTSFYTFNDDVIWENTHFLLQCYEAFGEQRFLEPVKRGMNFYLLSQDSCGGWAQQLSLDMKVAGARTYEPAALLPSTTFANALLLLRFYQLTGEKKYLDAVPKAIAWLEKTKLPPGKFDGFRTHPTFVESGTDKPIYVHRKGSNVNFGTYYVDNNDSLHLIHYPGKSRVQLDLLKKEYEKFRSMSLSEVTNGSSLLQKHDWHKLSPKFVEGLARYDLLKQPVEEDIALVVNALDKKGRWLTPHASISHSYIGDGQKKEQTNEFASTMVGDETDTSPFKDPSETLYISTGEYIKNMRLLISFLNSFNEK